jgi:hypothetical protein
VSDYRGKELVDGVIGLIDAHRPVHVSLVGGEPLVRFKELGEILPLIEKRGIYIQLVTSAVRPIPVEWAKTRDLDIVVSIDGLPAEHDVRRKPATYERILQNIKGHLITPHCTITRQMTQRPGYLREFLAFWSTQKETRKIWMSIFTPQIGETSYEILPWDVRRRVVEELLVLREEFPKLAVPTKSLDGVPESSIGSFALHLCANHDNHYGRSPAARHTLSVRRQSRLLPVRMHCHGRAGGGCKLPSAGYRHKRRFHL